MACAARVQGVRCQWPETGSTCLRNEARAQDGDIRGTGRCDWRDDLLENEAGLHSTKEIAEILGITEATVRTAKSKAMKAQKKTRIRRNWTEEQITQILCKSKPDKQLAEEMGVPVKTIHSKRSDMLRAHGERGYGSKVPIPFDLVDTEEL